MSTALYANPIPFSFFSDLVKQISDCSAKPKSTSAKSDQPSRQIKLVKRWIDKVKFNHAPGLDDPLPHGTIVIFLRLLFPEEGVRRRYGLQEYTFAKELERLYGAAEGRFACWSAPSEGSRSTATGSLGEEVKLWLEKKGKSRAGDDSLTFGRVDQLLDELACTSEYSAAEVQAIRGLPPYRARSMQKILADLLRPLSPPQVALMIQLILRDISPILYRPPSNSVSVSLTQYNQSCYDRIDLMRVLQVWDPRLPTIHRSVADLDYVATRVEEWLRTGVQGLPSVSPVLGLPIKVPKTEKPGTCSRATKYLSGKVAVETKYDGERLQIHVDLSLPRDRQIKIFSKSGRDSTETRHLLHPIIRASLGLDIGDRFASRQHSLLATRLHSLRQTSSSYPSPPTKLVLEGEMVPFNEDTQAIDEFWKLVYAKTDRGSGQTGSTKRKNDEETPETGDTGGSASLKMRGGGHHGDLHLKIVWFDALVLGEENLCDLPYSQRTARLEKLIRPIPGFSMLADKVVINFDHPSSALENLRLRFAKIITDRCEGLMLKPLTSEYNDHRQGQKWVKLKKDFIPGAGDTLDFVVVGASWQKKRGRELLVPPSVYTTFFVGLEAKELGAPLHRSNKKHYHILFSASYGLDREQLNKLCHSIRASNPQPFDLDKLADGTIRQIPGSRVYESACTSFTFTLADHLRSVSTRPTVIFPEPRQMELNGAGFQQSPCCGYYELRWPRITKFDRKDAEPISLSALQRTACEAMQITPNQTDSQRVAGWLSSNWTNVTPSPARSKETSAEKYEREWREWVKRLEAADRVLGDSSSLVEVDQMFLSSENQAPSSPRTDPPEPGLLSRRSPNTPPQRSRLSLIEQMLLSPAARLESKSPSQRILRPHLAAAVPASTSVPNLQYLAPPAKRPHTTTEEPPLASTSTAAPQRLTGEPSKKPKRPRISHPTPRFTISTPTFASTIARALSGPALPANSPYHDYVWSFFPPLPPDSTPPWPLHPHLVPDNYTHHPQNVVSFAGILPSASHQRSKCRTGWIWVEKEFEEDAVKWADSIRAKSSDGDAEKKTVWFLKVEALRKVGLCDLGKGNEVLTFL